MNRIIIDYKKCCGCKTCYQACFIDVYRWNEEAGRPVAAYPEECTNCMYCAAFCPVEAIQIDVDYAYQRSWSAVPGDELPIM